MNETTIRLHVEPLAEGGYVATSPDVPGLVAEGRTLAETAEIAQGLARKIVESCLDHGDPIPPALSSMVGNKAVELTVPVGVR
ncbi:MAG: antitoxin HicB [Phycisphaerales bacterium]|jgi:predicted RNase H-like HicB family nuclease|nr:antitoxin HicB [Phycisphaerales bacterium]